MNTEIDGPLAVWGGRIMSIIGVFGVLLPVIYFTTGINLIPGIRGDGILGFGAILASVFGAIGGALLIKTRAEKGWKKKRKSDPCKSVQETGKHDWIEKRESIKHTTYGMEFPAKCKACGKDTTMQFTFNGEKRNEV